MTKYLEESETTVKRLKNNYIQAIKAMYKTTTGIAAILLELNLNSEYCDISMLVGLTHKYFDNHQQCADEISELVDMGLIEIRNKHLYTDFYIDTSEINKLIYVAPLLHKVKHIDNHSNPYDHSYLISNVKPVENLDLCLDHINRLSRIKLSINFTVAKNSKYTVKDKELSFSEQLKKNKALKNFIKDSEETFNYLAFSDNEFYMNHYYDKRGRTYAQGYHINYMGTEYQKACIELTDKEIIVI